jgi:putative membrane protein
MYWWHDDWSWGAGLTMLALMAVFWGVVIWAVLALVRANSGSTRAPAEDPQRILARRFAAGEIDEDEYRHRLEVLRSGRKGHDAAPGSPR